MYLATILHCHYEHSGVVEELEEAISVSEEALSLCPPNHILRPRLLRLQAKLAEAQSSSSPPPRSSTCYCPTRSAPRTTIPDTFFWLRPRSHLLYDLLPTPPPVPHHGLRSPIPFLPSLRPHFPHALPLSNTFRTRLQFPIFLYPVPVPASPMISYLLPQTFRTTDHRPRFAICFNPFDWPSPVLHHVLTVNIHLLYLLPAATAVLFQQYTLSSTDIAFLMCICFLHSTPQSKSEVRRTNER